MNMSVNTPHPVEAAHAIHTRYREDVPATGWNPAIASILYHRSVRAYLPDPHVSGTVETLVAAASSAPLVEHPCVERGGRDRRRQA